MGRNQVDRQRRTDEVLYFLKDDPSPNVRYEGRTDVFFSPPDKPVWQIKRTLRVGDVLETSFANAGKYNCIWDDRVSYFPPPPPPPGDPLTLPEVDIYPGDGVFLDFFGLSVPGADTLVIADTVPSDKFRFLHRLLVDSQFSSRTIVYAGGTPVGSCQTGPGVPTQELVWTPGRRILPGTLVEVKIRVRLGAPVTDIGVCLQVSDY
jgi:hypothetical protein